MSINPLDKMLTQLSELLQTALVESNPPVIGWEKLHQVITNSFDSPLPILTDSDLAHLVRDRSFDWLHIYTTGDRATYQQCLLSKLMLYMDMDEYISWLPDFAKALNERYSIAEQVHILSRAEVLPGTDNSVYETRHLLTGRIACLALQSEEHFDSWVDAWMAGMKGQEAQRRFLENPLSKTSNTTKAYRKLKPCTEGLHGLSIIMTLCAVLNPNVFKRSVSRYTDATLYQLADDSLSGYNYNEGEYLRRNITYGLFLLRENCQSLILDQVGHQPIQEKNLDVCGALLTSSAYWEEAYLPVKDLIIPSRFGGSDSVDIALARHTPHWDGWLHKLKENPVSEALKKEVATFKRFRRWLENYSLKSRWGSFESWKHVPTWIEMMPASEQKLCFDYLISNFEAGITTQKRLGSGIFYGKALIAAFPNDEFAQATVSNQVGYLVKRALHDKHTELLRVVIERGWVTTEMVGPCIWTPDELERLTADGGIPKEILTPHLSLKVRKQTLSRDMGL